MVYPYGFDATDKKEAMMKKLKMSPFFSKRYLFCSGSQSSCCFSAPAFMPKPSVLNLYKAAALPPVQMSVSPKITC